MFATSDAMAASWGLHIAIIAQLPCTEVVSVWPASRISAESYNNLANTDVAGILVIAGILVTWKV